MTRWQAGPSRKMWAPRSELIIWGPLKPMLFQLLRPCPGWTFLRALAQTAVEFRKQFFRVCVCGNLRLLVHYFQWRLSAPWAPFTRVTVAGDWSASGREYVASNEDFHTVDSPRKFSRRQNCRLKTGESTTAELLSGLSEGSLHGIYTWIVTKNSSVGLCRV